MEKKRGSETRTLIHSDIYIIGIKMLLPTVNKLMSFVENEYTLNPLFRNWSISFLQDGLTINFEQNYGRNSIETEIIYLIPFLKECSKIGLYGNDVVFYTVSWDNSLFERGSIYIDIRSKTTKITGINNDGNHRTFQINWDVFEIVNC